MFSLPDPDYSLHYLPPVLLSSGASLFFDPTASGFVLTKKNIFLLISFTLSCNLNYVPLVYFPSQKYRQIRNWVDFRKDYSLELIA